MKKEIATKRIIQGVAFCFGALGIWLGYISFRTLSLIANGQAFGFSLCALIPLCVISLAVANQNLRSPGIIATRNLVAALMGALSYGIFPLLMKTLESTGSILIGIFTFCIIPLLLILLHCRLCRFLVQAAGYEEPTHPLFSLQLLINKQNISASAKKSIELLMPSRDGSTVAGYLCIASGWFLFSMVIFFTLMEATIKIENPDAVISDRPNVWSGIFWGAIVIYSVGRAHLKKIALAKAVIEMMEHKPEPPSEV